MAKIMQADDRAESRVSRNLVIRFLTLPVTMLAVFLSLSITVDVVGPVRYGQIALIATMSALLPFADLGLGAAVVNAVSSAKEIANDENVQKTLLGSLRLLVVSGGSIVLVSGSISVLGLWPNILGLSQADAQADLTVFIVLALFALGLPLGVGIRILQGAGRNDIATILVASAPLIGLAFICLFRWMQASFVWYAIAPGLGMTIAACASVMVVRHVSGLRLGGIFRNLLAIKSLPGTKVAHIAGPMLIVMIGLPIAMQTDRIVLSHFSSAAQLTEYSVAAQIYASMWGVIATGGQSLWPTFSYRRSMGLPIMMLWRTSILSLVALGSVMAVGLTGLGGWTTSFITHGVVRVSVMTLTAFGMLLIVQALHLPSGMLLTTSDGLKFQAKCVVAMAIINLPVSILLSIKLGAAGPVFSSVFTILFFQAVPGAFRVMRRSAVLDLRETKASQPEPV